MDPKALWTTFRKTRWFRLIYLALVSALGALMLPTSLGCFSIILIPLVILLVPHSFGERSLKRHAANGIFCLILISIFYGAIATPTVMSYQPPPLSASVAGTTITNGTVSPERGGANDVFTFTAYAISTDDNATEFRLQLYLIDAAGFRGEEHFFDMNALDDDNMSNGENYSLQLALRPLAHQYAFLVYWVNGTLPEVVATTRLNAGPFNAPYDAWFGVLWANAMIFLTFVGFFFFLVLMLYWWTRKAKDIRGKPAPEPRKRAEGGGEFTCTNCGADVSESDTKCPNCGASFESEAADEPADAKA